MLNLSRFTRFSFSEVETISTTPVVHSSKGMNILRSKDSNKFQNPEILLKLFCACIYSILVEVYYERMCKITVLFKVHIFGPWSVWVGISFGSTGVISHLIPSSVLWWPYLCHVAQTQPLNIPFLCFPLKLATSSS